MTTTQPHHVLCHATCSIPEAASIDPLDMSNYVCFTVHTTLTSNNTHYNLSSTLCNLTNTNTQPPHVLCYAACSIEEAASINPLNISNYGCFTVHNSLTSNNTHYNSSSTLHNLTHTNTWPHHVLCYDAYSIDDAYLIEEAASINPLDMSSYVCLTVYNSLTSHNTGYNSSSTLHLLPHTKYTAISCFVLLQLLHPRSIRHQPPRYVQLCLFDCA
jgi:hypothetical protein